MAEHSPSDVLPKGGGGQGSGNRRDEDVQKTAGDQGSKTQGQSGSPTRPSKSPNSVGPGKGYAHEHGDSSERQHNIGQVRHGDSGRQDLGPGDGTHSGTPPQPARQNSTGDGHRNPVKENHGYGDGSPSRTPARQNSSGGDDPVKQDHGHGDGTPKSKPPKQPATQNSSGEGDPVKQVPPPSDSTQKRQSTHGSSGSGSPQINNPSGSSKEDQPPALTEKQKSSGVGGLSTQKAYSGDSLHGGQEGEGAPIGGSTQASDVHNPSEENPLASEQPETDAKNGLGSNPGKNNTSVPDTKLENGKVDGSNDKHKTDSNPGENKTSSCSKLIRMPATSDNNDGPDSHPSKIMTALSDTGENATSSSGTKSDDKMSNDSEDSGHKGATLSDVTTPSAVTGGSDHVQFVPTPPTEAKSSGTKTRGKKRSSQSLLTGSVTEGNEDSTTHTGVTAPDGGVPNVKPIGKDKPPNVTGSSAVEQGVPNVKPTGKDKPPNVTGSSVVEQGVAGSAVAGRAAKIHEEEISRNTGRQLPDLPVKQGAFVHGRIDNFEKKKTKPCPDRPPLSSPLETKHQHSPQLSGTSEKLLEETEEDDYVKVEHAAPKMDCEDLSDIEVIEKSDVDGCEKGLQKPAPETKETSVVDECTHMFEKMAISKAIQSMCHPRSEMVGEQGVKINNLDDEADESESTHRQFSDVQNTIVAHNVSQDSNVPDAGNETSNNPQDNRGNRGNGYTVAEQHVQPSVDEKSRKDDGHTSDNSMAESYLSISEKINLQHNPKKDVDKLAEEFKDNNTGRFKQMEKENKDRDVSEADMNMPSASEVPNQPEKHGLAESLNSNGDNERILLTEKDPKIDTQHSQDNADHSHDETTIPDKKTNNGTYRIEKHETTWCLREIITKKLYPQTRIKAKSVVFEGTELLIVDGTFYQVNTSKGKPRLEKREDSDSDSAQPVTESVQERTKSPGQMTPHKEKQSSNKQQKEQRNTDDDPTTKDLNSSTSQMNTTQAEPPNVKQESEIVDRVVTSSLNETAGASPDTINMNSSGSSYQSSNTLLLEAECVREMVKSEVFRNAFESKFRSATFDISQDERGTVLTFQSGSDVFKEVQDWLKLETDDEKLEFTTLKNKKHIKRLDAVIHMFMKDQYSKLGTVFWNINDSKRYIQFCTVGEPAPNIVRSDLSVKMNAMKIVTLKCDSNTASLLPSLQADLLKAIGLCDVYVDNGQLVVVHFEKNKADSEIIDIVKQIMENNTFRIVNVHCKKSMLTSVLNNYAEKGITVDIAKEEDLKCITLIFPYCQMVNLAVGTKKPMDPAIEIRIAEAFSSKEKFELKGQLSVLYINRNDVSPRNKEFNKSGKNNVRCNVERMFDQINKLILKKINICIPETVAVNVDLRYLWNSLRHCCNRAFDQKWSLEKVNVSFADDSAYLECAKVFIDSRPEVWCDNRQSIELDTLEVSILKGNLEETEADVIVNSVGSTLQLHEGYVSKQLLNLAGQELQDVVLRKKNKIKIGEYVETESFKLKTCQFIFHGSVGVCFDEHYNPLSDEDVDQLLMRMKQLIIDCIKSTEAKKLSSIAFPALGTGRAKFNVSKVARTMFEAIKEIHKLLECVKKIIIVVDPRTDEQFKVFQEIKDLWLNTLLWDRNCSCILRWEHALCKAVCIPLELAVGIDKFIYVSTDAYSWPENLATHVVGFVPADGTELNMSTCLVKALTKALNENANTVGIYVENRLMTDKIGTLFCNAAVALTNVFHKAQRIVLLFSEEKWCKDTFLAFEQESVKSVTFTAHGPVKEVEAFLQYLRSHIESQADTDVSREVLTQQSVDFNKEFLGAKPKRNNQLQQSLRTVEPRDMTMHRDLNRWNPEMLEAGPESRIVIIEGIESGTSESSLKTQLQRLLNKHKLQLVFCETKNEAHVVCNIEYDPKSILNETILTLKTKPHPRMTILHCTYYISKDKQRQNGFLFHFFKKEKFKNPYFTYIEDKTGNLNITSLTSYGIQYIKWCLESYEYKRYSGVSERKYEVLLVNHGSDIRGTDNTDGDIVFAHDSIELVCRKSFVETIDKYITKLLQCEGEKDVALKESELSEANEWCRELEREGCICAVKKDERLMIVLFENYENIEKIARKIQLLQGKQIKATGRQRKHGATTDPISHSNNDDVSEPAGASAWSYKKKTFRAEHLVKYGIGSFEIHVYKASICDLSVDCIVNAANDRLQHGAGVARAIADRAGDELTKDGNNYVRSKGPIPVGEVAVTTAGLLPYRCVIHAVGPRWDDYDTNTLEGVCQCGLDLYEAVLKSFSTANDRGMTSVAIPAISSAIFGVPMKYCTMKYAKAVLDFCTFYKKNASLREIHFVDVNLDTVKEIQTMFNYMIREEKPEPYQPSDFLPKTQSRHSHREYTQLDSTTIPKNEQHALGGSLKENKQHRLTTPLLYEKVSDKYGVVIHKLKSSEIDQNIICYQGDILKVQVDSLVVVIDNYGGPGRICNGLKQRMDNAQMKWYDRDLKDKARKNSSTGSVIETAGYGTYFKNILHVVLPLELKSKSSQERRAMMKTTYQMLYQKIYENDMTRSVAMTLLAVDTEKPEDTTLGAEMFWSGFLDHCERIQSRERKNTLEVHLVCFTNYTLSKTIDLLLKRNKLLEQDAKKSLTVNVNNQVTAEELKEQDTCVICMEKITEPKKLVCGHIFCRDCIDQSLSFKQSCPTCGRVCGKITGDQPPGQMTVKRLHGYCDGYETCGKISIRYEFLEGRQSEVHPSPGAYYKGINRTTYLPDNEQGQNICRMLKVAFRRKLVFTIGNSRTTGQEGVITWNDIHHKTDYRPNSQFGYPDPTYLDRVTDELQAKGVTLDDIEPKDKLEGIVTTD